MKNIEHYQNRETISWWDYIVLQEIRKNKLGPYDGRI